MLICQYCGREFKSKCYKKTQKYCSRNCAYQMRIGYKHSDATKNKIRQANVGKHFHIGKPISEKQKRQISTANKGRRHTEDARRRISESSNPLNIPKNVLEKLYCVDGKSVREIGVIYGVSREPIKRLLKKYNITIRGHSAAATCIMNDPLIKKKQSESAQKHWKDVMYIQKQRNAHKLKPNKQELILQNILNILFPDNWEYVGDWKIFIDGKNPDFINYKISKIIELFGDYWHRGQNPQDRIDHFAKSNYKTLVVWEKELRDRESLTNKIISFVNNDGNIY